MGGIDLFRMSPARTSMASCAIPGKNPEIPPARIRPAPFPSHSTRGTRPGRPRTGSRNAAASHGDGTAGLPSGHRRPRRPTAALLQDPPAMARGRRTRSRPPAVAENNPDGPGPGGPGVNGPHRPLPSARRALNHRQSLERRVSGADVPVAPAGRSRSMPWQVPPVARGAHRPAIARRRPGAGTPAPSLARPHRISLLPAQDLYPQTPSGPRNQNLLASASPPDSGIWVSITSAGARMPAPAPERDVKARAAQLVPAGYAPAAQARARPHRDLHV